ncbi:EmrB/QacA subfamily drug resistance transporter [Elusimicrobium posterum]|uniref:MFS transporter n=1 Tax=Elusimicrobium posterum TaxID=3116653 RepID=UPI003C74CD55
MSYISTLIKRMRGSRRVFAWLVAIAFFMQMLDGTILNTALPTIAFSLDADPLRMQSVVISYMLTVAFLIPVSGWLADFFGTKRVFITAIFIFTLGSLCCALSNTLWQLVLSRILQGVGGALMVPVGRLALMRVFPKAELVSILSFITIPALVGPLVGPFVGGVIVQYVSWHWIFLINLPIGVICAVLTYLAMPKVAPFKVRFDWLGYFLFSASIILISLSLENVEESTLGLKASLLMFVAGALFLGAYARFSIARPWKALFKPRLFYDRSFTVGIIANLFLRFGGGAVPFLTPLLLQTALGYSPLRSGLTMVPLGIMSILAKTFVESILNHFGYRRFLAYNTIFMGFLLSMFAFIGNNTPYGLILVLLGCLGVVNSMQFTALNTLTLISVPQRDLSQANSLLSATMQISMSLGIAIASAALAFFGAHNTEIRSDGMLYAFHATFVFMGVYTMLGSILFMSPFSKNIVDKPKNIK